MMRSTLLLLFLAVVPLHAQDVDSTAMLFDDSIVHEFDITFYCPDYEDSLTYWYEHGEEYIPARVTYMGLVFDSVGVRYKGNSSYTMSRNTPKKPIKFKFDKYNSKKECFDVETLNFSNATKDPTFLREKICFDILGGRMHAPRTAYAALRIDGELLGLYTMIEQVDKKFLKRQFPDNDFNLYKASDDGATLLYRGDSPEDYAKEFELKTNENENDWSRFLDMVHLLNTAPDETFREQLSVWLEFESVIQLLAFNMVMSNFDSYTGSGRNFYIYDDESTGLFTFIPWDINEGFGSYPNNWNVFTQDILAINNLDRRPLNRRVLNDDLLRRRYLLAIRSLIDGPAHEDSIATDIQRWKTLIEPWVQADQNKLYTYQQFLDNLENDVVVGINMPIPGLQRFSRTRNQNLRTQLSGYASMSADAVPERPVSAVWNYPNPFTVSTTVGYVLQAAGRVTLAVSDVFGRELLRIDGGEQDAGVHAFPAIGETLPQGVYLYRVSTSFMSRGSYGEDPGRSGMFTVVR